MQLWHYGLGFSLALGAGVGGGCAAGGRNNVTGTGGATTGPSGSGNAGSGGVMFTTGITGSGGTTGSAGGDAGAPDGFGACSKFSAEAKQAPAAMLIVLDRSASMSLLNKWGTAQLAIVQAIDEDVFDTMSLGMSVFPSGYVGAPDCLCPGGGPTCFGVLPMGVACGYPTLPQVPIQPAGTSKSAAPMGVRHDLYSWLTGHSPEVADQSDASPIYDSLKDAYAVLKTVNIAKRLVVLITDGGGSCTSVSGDPARLGKAISDGMCQDWESPLAMNALISAAATDAQAPIDTFVVGVPGSNSHGGMQGAYATAPYSMLLALSTYAVSGSPTTVDPTCDKGATFTQGAADPAHPCHIDLSNGASFSSGALAKTIANIRGSALGCVYDLPPAPMGETIDKSQVNVVVTINGMDYTVPKRKDPSDMCLTSPCWDYDAQGKVDLIGITCSTVSTAATAKVEVYVGCATILK